MTNQPTDFAKIVQAKREDQLEIAWNAFSDDDSGYDAMEALIRMYEGYESSYYTTRQISRAENIAAILTILNQARSELFALTTPSGGR